MTTFLAITVGIPGCGKSTFVNNRIDGRAEAKREFVILSTDSIREEIAGDMIDQSMNPNVFEKLYERVRSHLSNDMSVVVDATNLRPDYRSKLYAIAQDCKAIPYAYRFESSADLQLCMKRNLERNDRSAPVPDDVVKRFHGLFLEHCRVVDLESEGWKVTQV